MRIAGVRACQMTLLALAAVALTGCVFVADMFNPGIWGQLGIDEASIVRPEGVVIVAFNNQTANTATFYATMAVDPDPLYWSRGSRNFVASVDGGKVRNEVLECPVGMICPGSLAADLSDIDGETAAITTQTTADGTEQVVVAYDPALRLEADRAFRCGDVVEIRLSEAVVDGEVTLAVTMHVIRGS